jgi:hypothetical protein
MAGGKRDEWGLKHIAFACGLAMSATDQEAPRRIGNLLDEFSDRRGKGGSGRMIISHTHKFIFIKSEKTAGTSIEAALSNACEGDDVVTPLNDYPFNRDEKGNMVHRAMNADRLDWWNRDIGQHVDALTIRSKLPDDVWNSYLKVSIVRDPWDRVVSLYTWKTRNEPSMKPRKRLIHRLGVPFDEVRELQKLFAEFVRGAWETNDRYYIIDGKLCVDFVIRYENLVDDFGALSKKLRLTQLSVPRLKSGIRPGQYHYSQYYNDESKAIVDERHKNDIRLFGYEFQRRQ